MAETLTDATEIGVGAACLLAAIVAWRRGFRTVAVALALAGAIAVVHGIIGLA